MKATRYAIISLVLTVIVLLAFGGDALLPYTWTAAVLLIIFLILLLNRAADLKRIEPKELKETALASLAFLFYFFMIFFLPGVLAWATNTGWVGYIFFMFFLLTINQVDTIYQSSKSKNWPTTEGVITSSSVSVDSGGDSVDTYGPRVSFRYSVSGKEYENNTIFYKQEPETNDRSTAQNVISRYPEGDTVNVHYHPRNPQISVLETGLGAGWPFIVLLIVSVIAIITGIWMVIIWPGFDVERFRDLINVVNPAQQLP